MPVLVLMQFVYTILFEFTLQNTLCPNINYGVESKVYIEVMQQGSNFAKSRKPLGSVAVVESAVFNSPNSRCLEKNTKRALMTHLPWMCAMLPNGWVLGLSPARKSGCLLSFMSFDS